MQIASLQEIAVFIYSGNEVTKKQLENGDFPSVRFSQIHSSNYWINKIITLCKKDLVKKPSYCEYGDILIVTASEDLENIGKAVAYLNKETCLIGNNIFAFKHKENPRYLSYFLSCDYWKTQTRKPCESSTIFYLKRSKLEKLKVLLPPLKEQNRIVEQLDKFNELCFDVTNGIPELISMVKKQQEYYKNKIFEI